MRKVNVGNKEKIKILRSIVDYKLLKNNILKGIENGDDMVPNKKTVLKILFCAVNDPIDTFIWGRTKEGHKYWNNKEDLYIQKSSHIRKSTNKYRYYEKDPFR